MYQALLVLKFGPVYARLPSAKPSLHKLAKCKRPKTSRAFGHVDGRKIRRGKPNKIMDQTESGLRNVTDIANIYLCKIVQGLGENVGE